MKRFALILVGLAVAAWGLWSVGSSSASQPPSFGSTHYYLPVISNSDPPPEDTTTPTSTATQTSTPTSTARPTDTATETPTPTGTASPTGTPTLTSSPVARDVVLVIDTSNSMTFDVPRTDPSGYWYPNGPVGIPGTGCNQDPLHRNPDPTYTGYCLPFDHVKHAAVDFVGHLDPSRDRLAIVTFDITPTVVLPLNNALTITDWQNTIKGLQVSSPRDPTFSSDCHWTGWGTDPSGCTNTSTGGGLRLAGGQFGLLPVRPQAAHLVILLTDGAANASVRSADGTSLNIYCPPSTWSTDTNHYSPFCRAADKTTRHTLLNPSVYNNPQYDPGHTTPYNPNSVYDPANYDADDYARDGADFVACAPTYIQAAQWCRDSLNYTINQGGQGAVIFPIGLGRLVIDNPQGGPAADGSRISPSDPRAGYAAGDKLLRYIARVGTAGDPNGADACQGVPPPALIAQPNPLPPTLPAGDWSYHCGNYYFVQSGSDLAAAVDDIAARIGLVSQTPTSTPTSTATNMSTITPTVTPTPTATVTPTPTITSTPTATVTSGPSPTPTLSPTFCADC